MGSFTYLIVFPYTYGNDMMAYTLRSLKATKSKNKTRKVRSRGDLLPDQIAVRSQRDPHTQATLKQNVSPAALVSCGENSGKGGWVDQRYSDIALGRDRKR